MVKAFDAEQNIELAGVPKPTPINAPIRISSTSIGGSLLKGLATAAKDVFAAVEDQRFGADLASARAKITESAGRGNVAETLIFKKNTINELLKKHGADALPSILAATRGVGNIKEVTDSAGNTFTVFEEGGVIAGDQGTLEQQLRTQQENDAMQTIANTNEDFPTFSRLGGKMAEFLRVGAEKFGGEFDGKRLLAVLKSIEGLPDRIQSIMERFRLERDGARTQAAREGAFTRAINDINLLATSANNEFDNPLYREILRDKNNPVNPSMIRELSRGFTNDLADQMRDLGVFTELGMKRSELEARLDTVDDARNTFHVEGEKAKVVSLIDLQIEAAGTELWKQIATNTAIMDLYNKNRAVFDMGAVGGFFEAVMKMTILRKELASILPLVSASERSLIFDMTAAIGDYQKGKTLSFEVTNTNTSAEDFTLDKANIYVGKMRELVTTSGGLANLENVITLFEQSKIDVIGTGFDEDKYELILLDFRKTLQKRIRALTQAELDKSQEAMEKIARSVILKPLSQPTVKERGPKSGPKADKKGKQKVVIDLPAGANIPSLGTK